MSANDELPALEPLDAEPGPALPLSRPAALAQADAVIARTRRRPIRMRLALLAAALLLLSTGAFAAVRVLQERAQQRTERAAPAARSTPPAAPLQEQAAVPQVPPAPPASDAASEQPAPQPSARDWLDLANAARGRRDFASAERLYLRAVDLYPGSDDAYAASLAVAELRAQQLGRPRDAIALYRQLIAARRAGALAEQARVGLARAYAALGERAAEREAWRELLRSHPHSWFAEEARARLQTR